VITTDRTVASVAEELGISEKTLGSWVRQERGNEDRVSWPAVSELERRELRRMRGRDREVWIGQILPKAVPYPAEETGKPCRSS
jgi:transposase